MSTKYYQENREKCIAYSRKWQIENPERYRQRKHQYYLEHRDLLRKRNNEYNKINIHQVRERKRKHRQRRKFFHLASVQNNRFKHENKITAFDLWKIAHSQRLICPLTGDRLTNKNISVDHIVPQSKGGKNVISNIRLTTKDINWFKRTMTDEELKEICLKVVSHTYYKFTSPAE